LDLVELLRRGVLLFEPENGAQAVKQIGTFGKSLQILDAGSAAGIVLRPVRGTQERGKRPEPLTRIAKT
jgi:hypothetical protein